MTPEQRAHFCRLLNNARLGECANQLEADGVTIATLTAECDAARGSEKTARDLMQKAFDVNRKVIAERDAAQDRAYRLAVAIMGGEDAPGLADSLPTETLETLARSNFQRHSEDIDRLTSAQAEIARLTAALATAREDGMREGAEALRKTWWRGELTSEDFAAVEKGAAT